MVANASSGRGLPCVRVALRDGQQREVGTASKRTLQPSITGVCPYNGLAIHKWVLNRYENLLLYSSSQRVTNRSI
jgi:hypothetical protein